MDGAHCTDVLAASFKVRDRSQLKVLLGSVSASIGAVRRCGAQSGATPIVESGLDVVY